MSLSVLDIEKGADELAKSYNRRIAELTTLEQELLKDSNVQLYVFLHEELTKVKNNRNASLNDYFGDAKGKCDHPLYVCVSHGMSDTYSYKCICVNCGATKYFKQYELNELYNNHRLIAEKVFESDFENYSDLFNYTDIANYYKETYAHLTELNENISDLGDDSIEMAAAEATFNHFMCKDKGKKIKKVL